MSDTLTFEVPADAPSRDLRRVKQEVKTAERNAKIIRAYPELQEKYTCQEAFQILANRHHCSTRTVRRVVWGG